MILRRMKLRNFRGVDERDVEFEAKGVTILEGPNEVGKSSLVDALSMLVQYKASSKKALIKAAKPVDKDAGPEVTIEAVAGEYEFTYRKRWLNKPITELTLTSPTHEQLTGDAAHDRVEAILAEVVDADLWAALRVAQGTGMESVSLQDQTALSKALDLAAGGSPTTDDDKALFGAVQDEYDLYWTGTGRPKPILKDAAEAIDVLEAEDNEVSQKLDEVQEDVEELALIHDRLLALDRRAEEIHDEVNAATEAFQKTRGIIEELRTAEAEHQIAVKNLETCNRDIDERTKLGRDVEAARRRAKEFEEQLAALPSLQEAGANVAETTSAFEKAREARIEAEAEWQRCKADADDRHYFLDNQTMSERRDAIDRARLEAKEARDLLAKTNASSENITALQEAEEAFRSADARMGAASAQVKLTGNTELVVDGQQRRVEGTDELRITKPVAIEVPGVITVEVQPGGDLDELRRDVEDKQRHRDLLLKSIGAKDIHEALNIQSKVAEAQRHVDELERIEAENIRDLKGYDDLVRRIEETQQRVAEHAAERDANRPLPKDFDEARDLTEEASKAVETGKEREALMRTPMEAAKAKLGEIKLSTTSIKEQAEYHTSQAAMIQLDIEGREKDASHEELVKQRQKMQIAVDKAKTGLDEVAARQVENDPASAQHRLENAKQLRADHQRKQSDLRTEQATRGARVELHQGDGLFEKQQKVQAALAHAIQRRTSIQMRASTAKLLFETMREERDNARKAYVAPLKEEVERLGRILYGPTFNVNIADDLSIDTRSLQGTTVTFTQLSAGAKEQLGIIVRIACAIIVAKQTKVPIILDDTLGNTDPERLKGMGAILGTAGKDCQVIILTCDPARFQYVGGATTIRLSGSRAVS